MSIQSESALAQAYELIENGNPAQAKVLLEDALTADLDNDNLVFAIHCCSFWAETFASLGSYPPYEGGELLVNQWKKFTGLVSREEQTLEKRSLEKAALKNTVYAFKRGIYSCALSKFSAIAEEKDPVFNSDVLRKAGLCHKRLGSYELALSCLTKANSIYQAQPAVLAELADCYDLCGETKFAKLMFREAFFLDAQKIELSNMDSPLINSLAEKVREEGYSGAELLEWIPVYGTLLDVFNIKRPLRAQEVGRLKQDIYARENELKNPANNEALIKPRLISMYLRLIDYYMIEKESVKRIKEITLTIKLLDSKLYKKFVE